MLTKIIKSGLHGKTIKLLIDKYNETKARVTVNGVLFDCIVDRIEQNKRGAKQPTFVQKYFGRPVYVFR